MTKVISLSDSAYAELKALKEGEASFSDVVHKLAKSCKKRSFFEFAGVLKESADEWEQIKKDIYSDRKRFKLREAKF